MISLRFKHVWFVAGLFAIVLLVILSLVPEMPRMTTAAPAPAIVRAGLKLQDKVYHFTAYLFLMVWFVQLYRHRYYARLGLQLMVLGLLIEAAQALMGHRQWEFADLAANGCGVLLGFWLSRTWASRMLWAVENRLSSLLRF